MACPRRTAAARTPRPARGSARVTVLRYPTASNLDELSLLEQVATLEWGRSPADLESADLVVLPGSKHVSADFDWVRERGLSDALERRVATGGRVLAICGGMQIAGRSLHDDGAGESRRDGARPAGTSDVFAATKRVGRVRLALRRAARTLGVHSRACQWAAMRSATGQAEPWDPCLTHCRTVWASRAVRYSASTPTDCSRTRRSCAALLGAAPYQSIEQVIDELTDAVLPISTLTASRRWRASDDLSLRGSWSPAARAPALRSRPLARAREHRRREGQVDGGVRRRHARGRARVAGQRHPVRQVGEVEGRGGEDRTSARRRLGQDR